jgi:hypothetical protein
MEEDEMDSSLTAHGWIKCEESRGNGFLSLHDGLKLVEMFAHECP